MSPGPCIAPSDRNTLEIDMALQNALTCLCACRHRDRCGLWGPWSAERTRMVLVYVATDRRSTRAVPADASSRCLSWSTQRSAPWGMAVQNAIWR